MTNEELKEKIIKIYNDSCVPAYIRGRKDRNGEELIPVVDVVADALIAAGIGDDSELEVKCEVLQRDVDNLTRTMEEGREELEEAKHRAEAAETVLKHLIKDNSGWRFIDVGCDAARCRNIGCGSDRCIDILVDNVIKRAEKELAEENKEC